MIMAKLIFRLVRFAFLAVIYTLGVIGLTCAGVCMWYAFFGSIYTTI